MSSETSRIEAFSDGVFAIAITLLILDVHVPTIAQGPLGAALRRQWPTYVAYLISFAFIGIMWVNHHRLFNHIRRSDNRLMFLNLLLLLGVSVVPFPTALIAAHYYGPGRTLAAAVYNGTYVVIAIFFNVLWRHIVTGELLDSANTRVRRSYLAAICFWTHLLLDLFRAYLGQRSGESGNERRLGGVLCRSTQATCAKKRAGDAYCNEIVAFFDSPEVI